MFVKINDSERVCRCPECNKILDMSDMEYCSAIVCLYCKEVIQVKFLIDMETNDDNKMGC